MKFTEPETIKKLYKIMRIIDEICQSNNFLYWSAFGTTLGCIRHGGIIPWYFFFIYLNLNLKLFLYLFVVYNIIFSLQKNIQFFFF